MTLLGDSERESRDERHGRVTAVVLAAGEGRRFGPVTKQLADLDGRPLIAHGVAAAVDGGADRVVVVVGHDGDAVAAAARAACPDVEVVVNPDHGAGQSTSFVAGIEAVAASDDAVAVVLLADQPRVRAASVRSVAAAVLAGAPAARAMYADGPGHPVAFDRTTFDRLVEVTGDRGAREILGELDVVPVLVAGAVPADVDDPTDLDRLRREPSGTSERED